MIKAIIFDFDGTLSNRKENAYAVFDDYLRPYFKDFREEEYEAVLQDMMEYDCNGVISVELRLIPFMKKYGKYLPDDFVERFSPYYNEQMFEYTNLKEETIDVLERLQGKYKLAVLSNGDSIPQHAKVEKVGIEKYFDIVLVSGDIGYDKPDARVFDYLCSRLGVANKECVMVGDVFATDILGAVNAGCIPVWLNTDPERPSKHYHGYQIKDLKSLLKILDSLKTV